MPTAPKDRTVPHVTEYPDIPSGSKPWWEVGAQGDEVLHPDWVADVPEAAKKCVEKWDLLAPYDKSITAEQWDRYYEERSKLDEEQAEAVDDVEKQYEKECPGSGPTKSIVFKLGRLAYAGNLPDAIQDSLAGVMRASWYNKKAMLRWWYPEDTNPTNVDATTVLYSPFGIGLWVELHYQYHFRTRSYENEYFSSVWAYPASAKDEKVAEEDEEEEVVMKEKKTEGDADEEDEEEEEVRHRGGRLGHLIFDEEDYATQDELRTVMGSVLGSAVQLFPNHALIDMAIVASSANSRNEIMKEAADETRREFSKKPVPTTTNPTAKDFTLVEDALNKFVKERKTFLNSNGRKVLRFTSANLLAAEREFRMRRVAGDWPPEARVKGTRKPNVNGNKPRHFVSVANYW